MITDFAGMLGLVGQCATVWLSFDPDVSVSGELVRLGEYGDCDIREASGEMRYCWPALGMEPAIGCAKPTDGEA